MAIIKFKVSRDRCYTVVNNTFINDNQLDAREKGLLLVIMSKPDNWDMSVEGLRSFCSDGTTSLRKGIQKLEEHGYLLRLNVRNARGNFGSMPYVVFERPLPEEKRNNPDYVDQVQECEVRKNASGRVSVKGVHLRLSQRCRRQIGTRSGSGSCGAVDL